MYGLHFAFLPLTACATPARPPGTYCKNCLMPAGTATTHQDRGSQGDLQLPMGLHMPLEALATLANMITALQRVRQALTGPHRCLCSAILHTSTLLPSLDSSRSQLSWSTIEVQYTYLAP